MDEIGEAVGQYAGATVMSAAAYIAWLESQERPLPGFSDDIRSVLVGASGNRLYSTEHNIGFWAEYVSDKDGESVYWGPIQGARVTAFDCRRPAVSQEDGSYVVSYFIPPCPCSNFSHDHAVHAQVRYQRFNPKSTGTASYFVSRPAYDYCSGFSECHTVPLLAASPPRSRRPA